MIREEAAKLTNGIVSLYQHMDIPERIFDDIRNVFDLFKHCLDGLPQEVKPRLEGPPHPSMELTLEIPIDGLQSSILNTNFKRSSATYHSARSGPLAFRNTPVSVILLPPVGWDEVPAIFPALSDSLNLFHDPSTTPSRSLGPITPVFKFRRKLVLLFGEFWIIGRIVCLN